MYRSLCLHSSTVAVSEIASRRWWCIGSVFPVVLTYMEITSNYTCVQQSTTMPRRPMPFLAHLGPLFAKASPPARTRLGRRRQRRRWRWRPTPAPVRRPRRLCMSKSARAPAIGGEAISNKTDKSARAPAIGGEAISNKTEISTMPNSYSKPAGIVQSNGCSNFAAKRDALRLACGSVTHTCL